MGGGGQPPDGAPPSVPSPHRRRRSRHDAPSVSNSGLDFPPSLMSPWNGRWKSRSLRMRSCQYLCTVQHSSPLQKEFSQLTDSAVSISAGTAPCDPLIAFDRFIVSATDDGQVCFYRVTIPSYRESFETERAGGKTSAPGNSATGPSMPVAVCVCKQDASIVCLSAAPFGVCIVNNYRGASAESRHNLITQGFAGHVVALTSEGDVYVLECSSVSDSLTSDPSVRMVLSWNTQRCNPRCSTFRYSTERGQWRVCIGYESGCIEEWHLRTLVDNDLEYSPSQLTKDSLRKPTESTSETDTVAPFLCWRGCFEAHVCSMSTLGMSMGPRRHETMSSSIEPLFNSLNGGSDLGELGPLNSKSRMSDFLAVVIQTPHYSGDERLGSRAPSSVVEVVNVAAVDHDWNTLHTTRLEGSKLGKPDRDRVDGLTLSSYCVWPEVGMDLQDSSTCTPEDADGHRRLSTRMQSQPSHGSDKIVACLGHNRDTPNFIVALSNGTIGLMNASIEGGSLSWGVTRDANQIVSPYAVVGLGGTLNMDDEYHIACCLRGGTVYVVPLDNDESIPVTVFLPPEEDSMECTDKYIQGFTAGMVPETKCDSPHLTRNMPVLVYSNAGGMLDVYACGIFDHRYDDGTLCQLLDNGSVSSLVALLSSLEEDDPLLHKEIYRRAKAELAHEESDQVGLEDIISSRFSSVRTLLLDLAEKDPQ